MKLFWQLKNSHSILIDDPSSFHLQLWLTADFGTYALTVCLPHDITEPKLSKQLSSLGRWYRHCNPRHRVSYPEDGITLKRIKAHQLSRTQREKGGWADIPFPTPIHSSINYVYTLDLDEGHLTISQFNYDDEVRRPKHSRINLDCINNTADLSAEAISRNSRDSYQEIRSRD